MRRPPMTLLALGISAALLVVPPIAAQTTPEVTLTRLDCGTPVLNDVSARFTDTFAYNGLKVMFTYSCYLIKHGDDYLLGIPATR